MLRLADRRRSLGAFLVLVFGVAGCVPAQQITPTAPPQPTGAQAQAAPPPVQPARPPKVALLLPLSGQMAGIGQDLLDAAQMAVFDVGQTDLVLVPRDSGETPEQAAAAARAVLAEGVDLVLGPLFANATRSVGPIVAETDVKVLSFSNDSAAAGGNVFVLGFRPEEQIDRILGFAESQGLGRVALVAPDDVYGSVAAAAFERNMIGHGSRGEVAFYSPGGDAGAAARSLVELAGGTGAPDAVLIADSGSALSQAAAALTSDGGLSTSPRLLGTARWKDDPAVLRDPSLAGSWIAAVPPAAEDAFKRRFASVFGRTPHDLAALSYDAVALAVLLAQSDRSFPTDLLTDPQGFVGSLGVFRLRGNGTTQHGLAILEVRPEGLSVVEPAPQSLIDVVATN
jgi:branched-chain amino acid transport system substrate-binding protein